MPLTSWFHCVLAFDWSCIFTQKAWLYLTAKQQRPLLETQLHISKSLLNCVFNRASPSPECSFPFFYMTSAYLVFIQSKNMHTNMISLLTLTGSLCAFSSEVVVHFKKQCDMAIKLSAQRLMMERQADEETACSPIKKQPVVGM